MKYRIAALLFLTCIVYTLQAQEFRVTKFKENILDLSAARSGVKDKNGEDCAILKFSVRDDKFLFEPNMGIVKTEKRVGEVWLYVPHGTKRITIRHPQLGILRDYEIPVTIEPKVVYESDIQITNREYMSSLIQKVKTDTIRIMVPQEAKILEVETERSTFFNVGVGFNVMSIMGPSAFLGVDFLGHVIEAGATIGLNKVENVSVYQSDNGSFFGSYDYNAMRLFFRYGYDIEAGNNFFITPQIGAAITNISGKSNGSSTGGSLFESTNAVSATIGCRFSFCLGKSIRLQLTPEYDFGVKKAKGLEVIENADSKIKSWGDGLNLYAGIAFHL